MTSMSAAQLLNTHHKAISYRPDVDGLRAIAVLSVVGFHAFPEWIKGGFTGVDIFFVISGFLISSIIMRELSAGSFSFADFYRRRVDRIFPALLTMMITLLAFGWFTLYADEYMELGKHTAGGAGFIANFVLLGEDGYFDNASDLKPLLHLWSLGIEEQFYILWPLILWCSYKLRINLLATVLALLGVSFYLNIQNIALDPTYTFYSPQTRFWELLTGAALAYFVNGRARVETGDVKIAALSTMLSIIGLGLFAYGFFTITKDSMFPGWQAVIPVLGATLIILAGHQSLVNRYILSSKLMVWFGLISFPLYLWHWPLLSIARVINGAEPSQEFRGYLVAAAIILSVATYKLIETPLKKFKSWKKTVALVLLMAGTGGAGYAVFSEHGVTTRANIKHTENVNAEFVGSLWKYMKNDICMNRYPYPESKEYRWWFCMMTKNSEPEVMLLGNSFANQLYPGLMASPTFGKLNVLSIGTCDPTEAALTPDDEPVKANFPCDGYRPKHQRELIDGIISNSNSLKFVIMDGLSESPSDKYIDALSERIDLIESKGAKVIIFTPHIKPTAKIKTCFARPLKQPESDCSISIKERKRIDQAFLTLQQKIQARHPSTAFFDQNDLLCNDDECHMVRDGMPMYRDDNKHLSEHASVQLVKMFESWAQKNHKDLAN